MDYSDGVSSRDSRVSVFGLAAATAISAGLAGCIALLYLGMAAIMETEGGFVATGGPYEIAHPAPDWVWLLPLSIMTMFVFGGLSVWASVRGWGIGLIVFAWMGLFLALGWNFLRLGLIDPPENLQGAWGWILSGVVFWVMGLAPALGLIRAVRDGWRAVRERQALRGPGMFGLPDGGGTTPVYLVAQLLGVAGGIAGAAALFAALTG